MPLESGSGKAVIGRNIARERHAGRPEKQAIAIAMSEAGKAKDSASPHIASIRKHFFGATGSIGGGLKPHHWRKVARALGLDSRCALDREYVRGGNPENKGQFSKSAGGGAGKAAAAPKAKKKEAPQKASASAPASGVKGGNKGAAPSIGKSRAEPNKSSPSKGSFSFTPIDAAQGLSPEDAKVDKKARAKLEADRAGMLKAYNEQFGKTSNADLARRMFKDAGYNGRNSSAVHEPASALAKDAWKHNLKNNPEQTAVLYAGISGAGKSSSNGILPDVENQAAAILDGNLSSLKNARKRIVEATEAGKESRIIYVWRDPVDAWANGVVKRMLHNKEEGGRVVPMSTVLENGPGSLNTIRGLIGDGLELGKHIFVVDNSLGAGKAKLMDREKFDKLSYPSNLREILTAKTKELYDAGHVSKEQYEALIK